MAEEKINRSAEALSGKSKEKLFDMMLDRAKRDGFPTQLLTADEVAGILRVSKKHVYKLMSSDKSFPKSIRLGEDVKKRSIHRFRKEEVERWLEARQAK